MTVKEIMESMSAEDLNKFIQATLGDATSLIIKKTTEQFKKADKLTIDIAKEIIWDETHTACDTIQTQVFGFMGSDEESKTSEETVNFIFILKEWVIERCNIALGEKSAKKNFSLDLACAIVEKIATVTQTELDSYFDAYIEREEKMRQEMQAKMDAYFEEEEARFEQEREESEIQTFGRILTQDERDQKAREFDEEIKSTRTRVKAMKLSREYSPGKLDDSEHFRFLLTETCRVLQEIGENPMPFLADVNACQTPQAGHKRIADYVKWVKVAA